MLQGMNIMKQLYMQDYRKYCPYIMIKQEVFISIPCSVGRVPLMLLLLRFNTSTETGSEDELIGIPPANEFVERSRILRCGSVSKDFGRLPLK